MMQRALVRAADIHAGLLAHGLEAFKFSELRRIVIRGYRTAFDLGDIWIFGHK